MNLRRIAPIVTAAALAACAGIAAAAPDKNDCKVTLSVGLNNSDSDEVQTKYEFGVSANSAESCAEVAYTLTVVEERQDGTRKTTPLLGSMRVHDQTLITAVPYTTDAKNTLKSFTVKMDSCRTCAAP